MNVSTAPDLATVLQQVLEPVLMPNFHAFSVGELSAALQLARAGIALSGEQATWLVALDQHCARMQMQLIPVLRSQRIPVSLLDHRVPKMLKPAAKKIRKLAWREHKMLRENLLQSLQGARGKQQRKAMRKSLKQAHKNEALIVGEAQIASALQLCETRLAKWQLKIRNKTNWRNIKKQGRAAQKLRLCRHFAGFFGHSLVTDEYTSDVSRYREMATQRGTVKWLEQLLVQTLRGNKQSAAAGALWAKTQTQRQKIAREMFVASVPSQLLSADFSTSRVRSDFPLQLHFGVSDKAAKA